MPVTRMNHAVLYVRDAARTAAFYRDVLDFRVVFEMAGGRAIFLQAPASTNDHDLGLFTVGEGAAASGAGRCPPPSRNATAALPARRPKTIVSSSELPPRRLAPCTLTQAHSPAAYNPGIRVTPSRSVSMPPMV